MLRVSRSLLRLAIVVLFIAAPTSALAANLAIVIGNNGSRTLGRAELRYADDDAAKYAALLGGTAGEGDVELLTRMDADSARMFPAQARIATPPTRAALDAAVARIVARADAAKRRGERVVFTFVFAGHGDVEDGRGFLELEDGRFFREDLEALLLRIPAARAHVVLDACNSVYMLAARKPGGTRFATPEDVERSMRARLAHVGTFLSTSADAQVYEWSQIESGVFSHAVRSGLAGAADLDGDGRITYGELRAFVRVASAGIPNPRFRPRIYARGPGGRDDEVIFEPRAAGASRKLALEAGAERRVTVLDPNEVPLVDVRLEAGFGPTLWLPPSAGDGFTLVERTNQAPERRTAVELSEGMPVARNDGVPSGHAARSGARPFDLLFSMAFGPRAVAALPPEGQEEEVYGVSSEDRERMRRLLDSAAETQRDRRLQVGLGSLAGGVLLAGTGAALLAAPDGLWKDPDFGKTTGAGLLGIGVAFVGVGASQLLTRSELEARRDAYVAALRARPEAFELAVRDAEAELLARAEAQRRQRTIMGIGSIALGALVIGAGAVVEVVDTSDTVRTWGRVGMAAGAAWGLTGLTNLVLRSEEERLAELWKKERAFPVESGTSSLRIRPLVGVGALGIGGTF